MKVLAGLIMFLYGFIVAVFAFVASCLIILLQKEIITMDKISEISDQILSNTTWTYSLLGIFIIIFIISIKLAAGRKTNEERKPIKRLILGGSVEISLETFESIVGNTIKKYGEIKEYFTKVSLSKDGIIINIKLMVLPDIDITELSQNIQNSVVESITLASSIKVLSVNIKVENISTSIKGRVE